MPFSEYVIILMKVDSFLPKSTKSALERALTQSRARWDSFTFVCLFIVDAFVPGTVLNWLRPGSPPSEACSTVGRP